MPINCYVSLYPNRAKVCSAQTTVEEHIEIGVPAEKLVLGVPFYGRMWKKVIPADNGLFHAESIKKGITYTEIDGLISNSSYTHFWD